MARKQHPSTPQTDALVPDADWSTAAARVRWLLDHRFQGNRSALAEAIGVSHTIISKVAAGQAPGRKLLAAIAKELRVSAAWLLTGAGQPFAEEDAPGKRPGSPMTAVLLPGSPLEHQNLLEDWIDVPGGSYTPSQYWLRLTASQPIICDASRGFRVGDRLLMETNRALFPREKKLSNCLCVVRPAGGSLPLKLGVVTYCEADPETGPARLEVDTFVDDSDPSKLVREVVYRHYPGGEVRHTERALKLTESEKGVRAIPLAEGIGDPSLPVLRYADIVAVWMKLLYRPGSVQL